MTRKMRTQDTMRIRRVSDRKHRRVEFRIGPIIICVASYDYMALKAREEKFRVDTNESLFSRETYYETSMDLAIVKAREVAKKALLTLLYEGFK